MTNATKLDDLASEKDSHVSSGPAAAKVSPDAPKMTFQQLMTLGAEFCDRFDSELRTLETWWMQYPRLRNEMLKTLDLIRALVNIRNSFEKQIEKQFDEDWHPDSKYSIPDDMDSGFKQMVFDGQDRPTDPQGANATRNNREILPCGETSEESDRSIMTPFEFRHAMVASTKRHLEESDKELVGVIISWIDAPDSDHDPEETIDDLIAIRDFLGAKSDFSRKVADAWEEITAEEHRIVSELTAESAANAMTEIAVKCLLPLIPSEERPAAIKAFNEACQHNAERMTHRPWLIRGVRG